MRKNLFYIAALTALSTPSLSFAQGFYLGAGGNYGLGIASDKIIATDNTIKTGNYTGEIPATVFSDKAFSFSGFAGFGVTPWLDVQGNFTWALPVKYTPSAQAAVPGTGFIEEATEQNHSSWDASLYVKPKYNIDPSFSIGAIVGFGYLSGSKEYHNKSTKAEQEAVTAAEKDVPVKQKALDDALAVTNPVAADVKKAEEDLDAAKALVITTNKALADQKILGEATSNYTGMFVPLGGEVEYAITPQHSILASYVYNYFVSYKSKLGDKAIKTAAVGETAATYTTTETEVDYTKGIKGYSKISVAYKFSF